MSNLMLGFVAAWAVLLLVVYLALHRSRRPRLRLRRWGALRRYRYVRTLPNGSKLYLRCEILPETQAPATYAAESVASAAHVFATEPQPVAPTPEVSPETGLEVASVPVELESAPIPAPVPEVASIPLTEPEAAAEMPAAAMQSTPPQHEIIPLEEMPIVALPATPGVQARKRQKERRRAMLTAFVALDAVLLLCILFTVVHNSRRVASLSVSEIAESNTAAQIAAENKQAEKEAAAATPTPVPTPAQYTNPLRPASNLGDAGEYVEGTWLTLGLQDADNSYSPSMTLSVADEGSGEQLYYQDRTPVDHSTGVSYCFSEPGRYIVTAYITAGDGTQSEYLTMDIKIYANVY